MLWLVARGLTNRGIAAELGVSHHTVKNTLRACYHKLRVDNRTSAAIVAIGRGMIDERGVT
jgi:DNA-binding NarL/FixJ family response regulator